MSTPGGGLLGGFAGGVVGGATVQLFLDDDQYRKNLATAEAKGKTSTNSMGQSFSKFKTLAVAAWAMVGTAALAAAASTITAASDQAEALTKVGEIFEGSAGSIESFAETAAEKLGISETAALDAAGTFGNLFRNVGFTADASADMSKGLVTLASDLASFNNMDPTEVLDKLRAGLAGEAEPLRSVGVFLSAAKVEAEAYASGLAKVGAELTDGQKIQARYNLILDETTLAQGDFERTSDGLANQQRVLQAQLEDLKVTIGQGLVPVMLEMVALAIEAADSFAHLGGIIEGVAGGGGESEGGGDGGILGLARKLEFLIIPLQYAKGALHGLNTVLAKGDEIINGGAQRKENYLEALRARAEALNVVIPETTKKIRQFANLSGKELKEFRKDVSESFDDSLGSLASFEKGWELTSKQLEKSLAGMAKEARVFAKDMKALDKEAVPEAFKKFLLEEGTDAVHAFQSANAEAKKRMVADWKDNRSAIEDAKGSLDKVTGGVRDLNGKTARFDVIANYHIQGLPAGGLPGLGDD